MNRSLILKRTLNELQKIGGDDILFLVFLLIGIGMHFTLRMSTVLWEDEVIAATHASQPLLQCLTNIIVNDIHPPLYFLELHFWGLASHSDLWLIINSIVLSYIALGSIFYVSLKLSNLSCALICTAIFSILPSTVWMAEEVRMYAFLSIALIWMYYFTHLIFVLKNISKQNLSCLLILSIVTIYTHAIGFTAILFYGLYAAFCIIQNRPDKKIWIIWIAIYGLSGLMATPLLLGDLLHKADMPPAIGMGDIVTLIASVITGEGGKTDFYLRLLGFLSYLAIVILGITFYKTRYVTLFFLIIPIIFCLVIGIFVKPLFKTNFFCTFYSPFFAFVISDLFVQALHKIKRPYIYIVISSSLIVLCLMAISNRLILDSKNDYYQKVTTIIKKEELSTDVVWIPQTDIFWGIARYLVGPDWGSPLKVNSPFRAQSGWWKVFNLLGPQLVADLKLLPETQTVTVINGPSIVTAISSQPLIEKYDRAWVVVYYPRDDLPRNFPNKNIGSLLLTETYISPPLELLLYKKSTALDTN